VVIKRVLISSYIFLTLKKITMPLENVGSKHLTAAQMKDIDDAVASITAILSGITQNLTDEERRKYGSINEQNKLIVNKVNDYHQTQATLQSPDVDWDEFEKDFADRQFADSRLSALYTLQRMLSDFKIVHDYDNYQASLTDYAYSQYKASTNTPGYSDKVSTLKQFFPNSGNKTSADPKP
jgi:hypothetical protein